MVTYRRIFWQTNKSYVFYAVQYTCLLLHLPQRWLQVNKQHACSGDDRDTKTTKKSISELDTDNRKYVSSSPKSSAKSKRRATFVRRGCNSRPRLIVSGLSCPDRGFGARLSGRFSQSESRLQLPPSSWQISLCAVFWPCITDSFLILRRATIWFD